MATKEQLKALGKKSAENKGLYNAEDMRIAREGNVLGSGVTAVLNGDYSNFANLPEVEKGYLATVFTNSSNAFEGPEGTGNNRFREIVVGRDGFQLDPEQKAKMLHDAGYSLNPVARKSLSMQANGNPPDLEARAMSEELDRLVMVDTLSEPTQDRKQAVDNAFAKDAKGQVETERRREQEYGKLPWYSRIMKSANDTKDEPKTADEALKRDREQRKSMAKMMLLMQTGDFHINQNGATETFNEDMSHAFGHGGRTAIVLPYEADSTKKDDAFKAVAGDAKARESAGMFKRAASTHDVSCPKANGPEPLSGYKEKHGGWVGFKGFVGSLVKSVVNNGIVASISRGIASVFRPKPSQNPPDPRIVGSGKNVTDFGMDVAIGGIGKNAPGKSGPDPTDTRHQVMNDGRSGHLYVGYAPGKSDEKGVLMVGLESDAPYRMNKQGHMHSALATPEENSPTGGYRTGLQGDKYGGRTVDLSKLTTQEVKTLTGAVDKLYDAIDKAETPEDAEEAKLCVNDLVNSMSGKRMSAEDLSNALTESKVIDTEEREAIKNIINKARQPMEAREAQAARERDQAANRGPSNAREATHEAAAPERGAAVHTETQSEIASEPESMSFNAFKAEVNGERPEKSEDITQVVKPQPDQPHLGKGKS